LALQLILEKHKFIEGKYPEFVLALGRSEKDEELFKRLSKLCKENYDFMVKLDNLD